MSNKLVALIQCAAKRLPRHLEMNNKLPTSEHILFVPRSLGHVRVKLTLVHNMQGMDTKMENLLEPCMRILQGWKTLPDNCEIILTAREAVIQLLREENENERT